jgi:hypothetical protein
MLRRVHRLATDAERAVYPRAYTFNNATRRFHDRNGFEIPGAEPIIVARATRPPLHPRVSPSGFGDGGPE